MVPPQPSDDVPQFCVPGHCVARVQPHTLGVPVPPHVSGAVQVPQLIGGRPQPGSKVPQLLGAGQVANGTQGPDTVTCAVAEWTAEAALPMTMNVSVPGCALPAAVSVSGEVPPGGTVG